MSTRTLTVIAVAVPHLVVAAIGLTHPATLTVESAHHWQVMHTVLLPLFPLLALGPWLVARLVDARSSVLVGVIAFVYACFYTGLDVLAGIGGGAIKAAEAGGLGIIFPVARELGLIGSLAHLAATALAAGLALRVTGLSRGLSGLLLVLAGSFLYLQEHVYRPWGVLAMVLLAAGWSWLVIAVDRREPTSS
jgi:hypothetical protein